MSCTQTLGGIARDCAPSMGGIVEVYIANAADVSAVAVKDGKISAITMAASAKFKGYSFTRQAGSLTSTYTIDKPNGVTYVQSDLVLPFNRMETAKRVEMSALAAGELACIVKDANGLLWYLGKDGPVMASAGDGQTGTAWGDRNGYSITLQDTSLEMPFEILTGEGGVDLSTITD